MYVNNNLYFVGNLRYLNIHFQEVVLIYAWPVEKSVSLANSPYFPLSSIIPFVRLTKIHTRLLQVAKSYSTVLWVLRLPVCLNFNLRLKKKICLAALQLKAWADHCYRSKNDFCDVYFVQLLTYVC